MIAVSTGCPAGVGPEVSVAAAARLGKPCVLVGDSATLLLAAERVGVSRDRLVPFARRAKKGQIHLLHVGPALGPADRRPGRPSRRSGAAQLAYVDVAYGLVEAGVCSALVTGPVSKAAIARSGAPGARGFRGHTEHLAERAGAPHAVMCFASRELVTSLVTTHLPLARVPKAITRSGVARAAVALADLLAALGVRAPHIAVCSLNPHAGEGELLGTEERTAIVPGIRSAARSLGRRARLCGPLGAESAYRKARAGDFDGVVAMYHDQATIPLKLVSFGDAVNVTMGLGVVRTSVDHGTAYDIAWQGRADPSGMQSAMRLALSIRQRPR
ncbi:MAG: 4-hydroxythreonine-4-phosphate dehydrogenase PdxA [Polyangiaceae bacterium]|nr:4-hydroxythreonine-4-phosphate dehydrogenase PdxA [Polyangiaceae bacterium]MCL4749775.1 4-hydroxythreonine-4-phosphate dehydrogenase PdxA [Myxococcales bacterium]